jgi:transcription elongation GreA/GreB family factor
LPGARTRRWKNECRRSTNKDHCEDQLAELEEQKADALEALEDRRSQAGVAAAPATQSASVEARLAELKGLLERGVITPDEYHAKRSQILSEL